MSPASPAWVRPAHAMAWQRQLMQLDRRSQHLAQSARWALLGGALISLVNGLWNSPWVVRLALGSFAAVLFLYPLGVERLRAQLAQRLALLAPMDPDPAQLTRWQGVAPAVAYRQACMASGVPLLVGDGQWMDRLFAEQQGSAAAA